MPYQNLLRTNMNLLPPNLLEGVILKSYLSHKKTVPNRVGRQAKVQTITPGVTSQTVTTYRLRETVTNQSVTFVSDATPTAAEVVTGLLAALRANPILNGLISFSGTTTVIATARQSGTQALNFNFVDNGTTPAANILTVANTTEASDPGIVFAGRGLSVGTSGIYGLSTAALSANNVFAGIVGVDYVDSGSSSYINGNNGIYYPPDSAMTLLQQGEICVKNVDTATADPTKPVFMVHSGSGSGTFGMQSSLPNSSNVSAFCRWQTVTSPGELGIISVNVFAQS